MTTIEPWPSVQPGEPAPDFTLPAIEREGTVSLADYRGRSALLLVILRGLYCPFCRRALTHVGLTREKLEVMGVETLGILATPAERVRLYLRYHPSRVPLAADPELYTHTAYGLPKPAVTPEYIRERQLVRINPTGELPESTPVSEHGAALNRLDGFEPSDADKADRQRILSQRAGHILVDREGIVRWVDIECADGRIADTGRFPTEDELLAAARTLTK